MNSYGTLAYKIASRIRRKNALVFVREDFADLGGYDQVGRILRELARKGFVVQPDEWRRAAHRCADAFYQRVTGSPGQFDTRIAYVAQTGSPMAPVKRLALVNLDGELVQAFPETAGRSWSADGTRIAVVTRAVPGDMGGGWKGTPGYIDVASGALTSLPAPSDRALPSRCGERDDHRRCATGPRTRSTS